MNEANTNYLKQHIDILSFRDLAPGTVSTYTSYMTVRRRITIGCNSKLKSRLTPIRPRGLACNCTFLSA